MPMQSPHRVMTYPSQAPTADMLSSPISLYARSPYQAASLSGWSWSSHTRKSIDSRQQEQPTFRERARWAWERVVTVLCYCCCLGRRRHSVDIYGEAGTSHDSNLGTPCSGDSIHECTGRTDNCIIVLKAATDININVPTWKKVASSLCPRKEKVVVEYDEYVPDGCSYHSSDSDGDIEDPAEKCFKKYERRVSFHDEEVMTAISRWAGLRNVAHAKYPIAGKMTSIEEVSGSDECSFERVSAAHEFALTNVIDEPPEVVICGSQSTTSEFTPNYASFDVMRRARTSDDDLASVVAMPIYSDSCYELTSPARYAELLETTTAQLEVVPNIVMSGSENIIAAGQPSTDTTIDSDNVGCEIMATDYVLTCSDTLTIIHDVGTESSEMFSFSPKSDDSTTGVHRETDTIAEEKQFNGTDAIEHEEEESTT